MIRLTASAQNIRKPGAQSTLLGLRKVPMLNRLANEQAMCQSVGLTQMQAGSQVGTHQLVRLEHKQEVSLETLCASLMTTMYARSGLHRMPYCCSDA